MARRKVYTIQEPIKKLFGDALTIPREPTLIISDTHCPYQNKQLLEAAITIARSRHVKHVVHAGDLIDGAAYNTQARSEPVPTIETEIEHARSLLYTLQSYFDTTYIIPGNHDMYYVKKEKLTFHEFIYNIVLLGKFTSKFVVTDYDYLFYDDYAIIGHLTNGYDMVAGKIAASLAVKYNMHSLVGHDHIMGAIQAENGKMGISIGAMFVPGSFSYKAKSYNTFPHSMLGFAIICDGKIYHFDDQLNERVYE